MSCLRRFVVSVLVTMSASAAYAQAPAKAEGDETAPDPDVTAAEKLVREIRGAAVVGREAVPQDKQAKGIEPSAQAGSVKEFLEAIEAGSTPSPVSLRDQIAEQQARLEAMRQVYSEQNPGIIKAMRRLEELQAGLETEEAATRQ